MPLLEKKPFKQGEIHSGTKRKKKEWVRKKGKVKIRIGQLRNTKRRGFGVYQKTPGVLKKSKNGKRTITHSAVRGKKM